jgi:hypothetical protein
MAESSHMHAIVELDQCRVAVLPFTAGSRLATPDVYSKACQMLSAPPADLEELLVESGILRVVTAEEAARLEAVRLEEHRRLAPELRLPSASGCEADLRVLSRCPQSPLH